MLRPAIAWLAIGVLSVGCSKGVPRPDPAGGPSALAAAAAPGAPTVASASASAAIAAPTAPASATASVVAASSAAPGAAPLVVASEGGIVALDEEGAVARKLSSTPRAAFPRLLRTGADLVFLVRAPGIDPQFVELRRLDLASSDEAVVARLAPTSYGSGADARPLRIEGDDQVTVDPDRGRACLDLMNRNMNMASCWLSLEVDLASGAVARRTVVWEENTCGPEPAPHGDAFRCRSRPTAPAAAPRPPRFHLASTSAGEGFVLLDGARALGPMGDFAPAGTSPSGRWTVLRGHRSEGDYIHFHAVLLDGDTGELVPLLGSPAWPAPITLAEVAGPREALDPRAGDFVGETSIRWVRPEVLLAGGQLYLVAKRRVVSIAGDMAL